MDNNTKVGKQVGWPNRSFDFYISALNDADSRVRRQAVAALETIGNKGAIIPLIPLLQDPDSAVRGNAARALGKLEALEAVEWIIKLVQDPAQEVRVLAIQALAKLKDPLAVEALITALDDPYTFYYACRALGSLQDARAVEPLVAIIAKDDPNQSFLAAIDIGQLGKPAVKPLLHLFATTGNELVRKHIIQALIYIKDPSANEVIRNYQKSRKTALLQGADISDTLLTL
jgi:HEAT repeat protein